MEHSLNTDLIFYLAIFAVMSAIIIGAGVLLAKSGDRIADVTGLGGLLIGMVLVAAATSLPEIAVAVSAVVDRGLPRPRHRQPAGQQHGQHGPAGHRRPRLSRSGLAPRRARVMPALRRSPSP